ncbi:MAG: hypothetical protein GY874_06820 [Desulfobacteraceae bacterium]|nr:hypothetical protein [Desulfobacteraceae bacterium]
MKLRFSIFYSIFFALVFSFMTGLLSPAVGEISEQALPQSLLPWKDWVLYGHEQDLCPAQYNDGSIVRCGWPSRLKLEVSFDGGRFEQRWLMFARTWVALPGSDALWPGSVTVDGDQASVVKRNGLPMVVLTEGEHQIRGRFFWRSIPELINIPPSLGLLSLFVKEQMIEYPQIDEKGRLWLYKSKGASGEQDRLKVSVFRLLNDTVPMRVNTLVRLDVSGKSREIVLKDLLLPTAVPMTLDSKLPARINTSRSISVQARAGRWEINFSTRLPGPVHKIGPEELPYGQQIWSFKPQHDLRIVEIQGPAPVEPAQTEMPSSWHRYAAYLINSDSQLSFKQIRRGDSDPAPDQLNLHRTWWLDFDGQGFSIHDKIIGALNRQWRLTINAPIELGRVAVEGKDQMITVLGPDKKAGIELRSGRLSMAADSRLAQRTNPIRVVGWDHDFQKVSGFLHLAPGWSLVAAANIDSVSQTWLKSWTLLDFFLVLIISLAIFKLRNIAWAFMALVTMILIYQEPGSPRIVWLHLLAVLALLPLLSKGWFKKIVFTWGIFAGIVLVVIAVPFMVQQIRWGLYPQLAPHACTGQPFKYQPKKQTLEKKSMELDSVQRAKKKPDSKAARKRSHKSMADTRAIELQSEEPLQKVPESLIPTGPGLPDWRWHCVKLNWNGPVSKEQTMRLYLLSPKVNMVLAFVRVILLAVLIWSVLDWRSWWKKVSKYTQAVSLSCIFGLVISGLFIFGVILSGAGIAEASETRDNFPPRKLLDELRQRLLEKPDCLPFCADISRMEILASNDKLQVMLEIHAAEQAAVPLPAKRSAWNPNQILLDNVPINGLIRDKSGQLWAYIPKGFHTIVMIGMAGPDDLVRLPLPLKPHTASVAAEGWRYKGVDPNGRTGSSIELTRIREDRGETDKNQYAGVLPFFLEVERKLVLGHSWQVITKVRRVTPTGVPIVVNVPLLESEAVTTSGIQVEKGQAIVSLAAGQTTVIYRGTLEISSSIKLSAPKAVAWTETWILDASPIWHCDLKGIPVIHHQSGQGQWQPQWRPWPGESATINVHRLPAIDGQHLTIDNADLILTPSQRIVNSEMILAIRTSKAVQHTLTLPPKSNIQKVTINNKSLPVRLEGNRVILPLQSGEQTVKVQWRQLKDFSTKFKAPRIDVGAPALNARVTFKMPERWILFLKGPDWGPAVLLWSYLAVIALIALFLGRLSIIPLKTWQWLLLGLGLTQVPVIMSMIIAGWIIVLGLRKTGSMPKHGFSFNSIQTGLVIWTAAALVCMYAAVKAGLVGQPEMQISGNDSYYLKLNWTQDRIMGQMPRPWVVSMPVMVFRGCMLVWSLWLASSLLNWLKWGWKCFGTDGFWRKVSIKTEKSQEHVKSGNNQ